MTQALDDNSPQRGTRLRDPSVDQAVSWGLSTLAALAFGIGAHEFSGLTQEVKALRENVTASLTRIAVLEAEDVADRIDQLEARLRVLEQGGGGKR